MYALRVLAGVAITMAALVLSASAASACCSCGCGYQTYTPPPVFYAPRPSCGGCGYQTYGTYYAPPMVYAPRPAYRVDQGPSYDVPPMTADEPVPEEYGYPRPYRFGGYHHHRHYRDFVGYRSYGPGPRLYGPRHYGPRNHGPWMYRHGPVRVRS